MKLLLPFSGRKRFYVAHLLLFVGCAAVLTIIAINRIFAAQDLCVRVLQTNNYYDLSAPSLSTFAQVNIRTQQITAGESTDGLNPAAYSPTGKYVVYWKTLADNTANQQGPITLGFYLRPVQEQKSSLLTTLSSRFLYDMEYTWVGFNREKWSPYWRWSPDSRTLAYVGYGSLDKPETPYLGIASMDGTTAHMDLSPLPQVPLRIFINGWSADNQYLAFSIRSGDNATRPPNTLWIWKAGDTGSKPKVVNIPYAGGFGNILWTRTGHKLIILHSDPLSDSSTDKLTLWTPESGIKSDITLTLQYRYLPTLDWSPDGQQLVINDCSSHCFEAHLLIGVANDKLTAVTDKITRNTFPNGIEEHSYRVIAWFKNGDALISFFDQREIREDLVRLNLNTNVDEVIQSGITGEETSPDGQATLFTYDLNGQTAVDIISANSERMHVLDVGKSPFPMLSWSADSHNIAIAPDETHSVITTVDGQHQWKISAGDFVWLENDWLVYAEVINNRQHLHLLNLQTSQTFDIGQSSLEQPIPFAAFSPDRQLIAFRSGKNELSIYSLASGQMRTLITDEIWISDGRFEGFAENGTTRTLYYPRSRPWMKERLAWSPDGSQVAFFTLNADRKAILNLVSVSDLQVRQLYSYKPNDPEINYSLAWTVCN